MPKTKQQCETLKAKRRQDMIVAATNIFAFYNYQDVTTDTITASLKCSHGLFYHYYKSKEEIYFDVLDKAISATKALIDAKEINNLKGSEALRCILGTILDTINKNDKYLISAMFLLLNSRVQIEDIPQTEEILVKSQLATNKIFQLIEKGQKDGTILAGNPEEYNTCLSALIKGLLYNRLMSDSENFVCPSINTVMNLVEVR